MRVRTFFLLLFALVAVVAVAYLSHINIDLLNESFRWSDERFIPLYVALVATFLLGFLPSGAALLIQTLNRELTSRRERRRSREMKSLQGGFRRALDFQADGQFRRASSELESLVADQPEDFGTLLLQGELLRHRGDAEDAIEIHRRVSVLYPQSVAVLYELADDYEAKGEPQVAVQIRDRILRDFPGFGLQALRRQRNDYLASQDWREAGRIQDRLDALLAESGEPAEDEGVRLGLAYQRSVESLEDGQAEEARNAFLALLKKESRFVPAAIMAGESELILGNPAAAEAQWRSGFEVTGSPVFLQRIEDHFIEREEPLKAIETLHGLIASSDHDTLPRFYLGRLYYRLEMHEEALNTLGPLAEELQIPPTYHYLLARIHERRGEMRRAVEAYCACVQQAGIAAAEYRCRSCRAAYPSWQARCETCGSWNSVDADFELARVSSEDLGVRSGPIWAIYNELPPKEC